MCRRRCYGRARRPDLVVPQVRKTHPRPCSGKDHWIHQWILHNHRTVLEARKRLGKEPLRQHFHNAFKRFLGQRVQADYGEAGADSSILNMNVADLELLVSELLS